MERLAEVLRKSRIENGWSQRMLSQKSGIPQSHISKIENGGVDLQVSSLMELSRALGLELMLIPQTYLPVVQAMMQGKGQHAKYQLEEENGRS